MHHSRPTPISIATADWLIGRPFVSVLEEEMETPMKQGIVAILGEETRRNAAFPIRRTFSADMSSKSSCFWLQQNGCGYGVFSEPNKAPGSSAASEQDECEGNLCQAEVWRNIQQVKDEQKEASEGWSSLTLTTHKSDTSVLLPPPPPYVHPLVKRSRNFMSEKSLETCTESLGSENGSECDFSCYSCSEAILKRDKEKQDRKTVIGANNSKSVAQPLPPPLPSIFGGDGTMLHIQSRRENGRLVVDGVMQQPRNHFLANRQDGRLVLSLVRPVNIEVEVADTYNGRRDGASLEDQEVEADNSNTFPTGTITVHKSVVKNLAKIRNKNPRMMMETQKNLLIPKSLPRPHIARLIPSPPPPMSSASLNAYDYFWRGSNTNTTIASAPHATTLKRTKNFHNNMKSNRTTKWNEKQDMVVTKSKKGEYLLPYLKGCKETRRSILFWEPYCIATS